MGYLRYYDYLQQIQDAPLKAIITNNQNVRLISERAAQAEIISYLTQKYDTSTEFRDTNIFAFSDIQKAYQLVELNFTLYSPASTYTLNALTTYGTQCYICTTAITVAEAFTPAHWTLVGNQYDLCYLDYPYPLFNAKNVYAEGDVVFWNNKIYSCKIKTSIPDHNAILQKGTYSNVGFYNIFPDDKVDGLQYWGVGVPYSVTGLVPAKTYSNWSAGTFTNGQRTTYNGIIYECIVASTNSTPGTDITKWQPETWIFGDNRSAQLVQKMCYIVIRYCCVRIPGRNVPKMYEDNYQETIQWLKDAIDGQVVADVPEKQILNGTMTRYGGQIKNKNNY